MKKTNIILCFALSVFFAASCQKPFEVPFTLGLTAIENDLGAADGSTPVPVYSNTHWTAELSAPVKWASLDRLEGDGLGQVKFQYAANYGRCRSVSVIIKAGDETRSCLMKQAAMSKLTPLITLGTSRLVEPEGGADTLSFNCNFLRNSDGSLDELVMTCDSSWVSGIHLDAIVENQTGVEGRVICQLAQNESGEDRSAKIVFSHVDGDNQTYKIDGELLQSK